MTPGALIGPIIIAIGLVGAAIAFAVVGALFEGAGSGTESRVAQLEAELVAVRRELSRLGSEQSALRAEIERRPAGAADLAGGGFVPEGQLIQEPAEDGGTAALPTEEMTELMLVAAERFNRGITQPRNSTMLDVLGNPRSSYTDDCQPVTDDGLRRLLETRAFGTFRVSMIRPALDSLQRVLARLEETDPDIRAAIGTAGALCARLIRGSRSSISNHSWGTAIDVKLQGELDRFGDDSTQFGLLIIAEAFNAEGWYWGAAYSREDSMHFEVGEETLRAWQAQGLI